MSSKISSKKLKKPLDLALGKASSQKEVDLSHVRLPIDTSVFGLKQVLSLFETATNEVKSYLAYECDLMYECRLCRTIFRSLANFILHKRKYCREKYSSSDDPSQRCRDNNGVSIIHRDIEAANKIVIENENSDDCKHSRRHLNPVIEMLIKKQEHKKFVEDLKNQNLSDKSKTDAERKIEPFDSILLETIDSSDIAVFQTAAPNLNLGNTEFMKSEVMEIHSIFNDDEAVVGMEGNVLSFNTNKEESSKKNLICTECDLKFSTKKTLAYHVKYKHNKSRLVYPCPECKDTFANAWCVYRHLLKVHRKTSTQIRKYRNQIHNSAICKRVEQLHPKMRKAMKDVSEENDEENEWLDNVEGDNDLQMCGGCGKRFERKAALISHSVMCTKRIAICNSIKENNAKKKEIDDKESKLKHKSTKLNKPQVSGSAKRKPENLLTYKPKPNNFPTEVNTVGENKYDPSTKVTTNIENKNNIFPNKNIIHSEKNHSSTYTTNGKRNDHLRKMEKLDETENLTTEDKTETESDTITKMIAIEHEKNESPIDINNVNGNEKNPFIKIKILSDKNELSEKNSFGKNHSCTEINSLNETDSSSTDIKTFHKNDSLTEIDTAKKNDFTTRINTLSEIITNERDDAIEKVKERIDEVHDVPIKGDDVSSKEMMEKRIGEVYDVSIKDDGSSKEKMEERKCEVDDVSIKEESSGLSVDEVITISEDDDDIDTPNSPNDLIKNSMSHCEEETIVSVVKGNINHSDLIGSPCDEAEESSSSKLSDRSDSPCRGFESVEPFRLPQICFMCPFMKFQTNTDKPESTMTSEVKTSKVDQMTISQKLSSSSDGTESKEKLLSSTEDIKAKEKITSVDDTILTVEATNLLEDSSENKENFIEFESFEETDSNSVITEVNSDISLNNNTTDETICGNYELALLSNKDNDSQNVSFKSFIKNIISEDQYKTDTSPLVGGKNVHDECENSGEELTIIAVAPDQHITPSENKTDSTEVIPSGKEAERSPELVKLANQSEPHNEGFNLMKSTPEMKRKRTESSPDEIKRKKQYPDPNKGDDALIETEDEAFISRIAPHTNLANLSCSPCNSRFKSLSHLLMHMSIHFSWYRYQCSKCLFMSYNRHDCISHVHKEHQLPFSRIQNTVLPIPTWKSASISDNMVDLEPLNSKKRSAISENKVTLQLNTELLNNEFVDIKFKPVKYTTPEKKPESFQRELNGFIDLTTEMEDEEGLEDNLNVHEGDVITGNKNDDDSIISKTANISIPRSKRRVSPNTPKKAIIEVILGNERKKRIDRNKDAQGSTAEYVRPPRNRVKSIKTSQKDFIYDLNLVRSKTFKGNSSNIMSKHLKVPEPFEDKVE